MLTSAKAALLRNAIGVSVDKIGTTPETAMPKTAKNSDAIAYDYFVSQQISRAADNRLKRSIKAAIAAGVMFDHKKTPREPGATTRVYQGDIVDIFVDVKNGATRVDIDAFVASLIAIGVEARFITAARFRATTHNAPAHTFSASLVAEQE